MGEKISLMQEALDVDVSSEEIFKNKPGDLLVSSSEEEHPVMMAENIDKVVRFDKIQRRIEGLCGNYGKKVGEVVQVTVKGSNGVELNASYRNNRGRIWVVKDGIPTDLISEVSDYSGEIDNQATFDGLCVVIDYTNDLIHQENRPINLNQRPLMKLMRQRR